MRKEGKHKRSRGFFLVALAGLLFLTQMGWPNLAIAQGESEGQENFYTTQGGTVDFQEGEASIVIYGNQGQSLIGKTFRVHKLFEAENAENMESINYTVSPAYEDALRTIVAGRLKKERAALTEFAIIDYLQTMNSYASQGAKASQNLEGRYSDYRYFVEELSEQMSLEGIEGTSVIVRDVGPGNSVELSGLAYGYYMVEDVSDSEGEHTAISMPMLTTANPRTEVNLKSDYPVLVQKIREDDNQSEIGEEGWNDLADFEIGQDVPYRYQSDIPDINGYHTYYYAWHTQMDEALTLQEDTIQITMTGIRDSKEAIYELAADEYTLLTDRREDTFVIEIQDLKAICDREFPNFNENQENVYGQQMTVYFLATLGDKAALDTGRPGFENDVRLEFSNNPNASGEDERGFTPWDTVVCFTYQLCGVKVNNYGASLSGAVFRLYEDEECTSEVQVKKVASRYLVSRVKTEEEDMGEDELDLEALLAIAGAEGRQGSSIVTETAAAKESVQNDSQEGDAADDDADDDAEAAGTDAAGTDIVSDENGEFMICGLDGGVYYLKEITAPTGYRPLKAPVKLEVTPTFPENRNAYVKGDGEKEETLTLSAKATITTYTNGTEVVNELEPEINQEMGSMAISIVNEVGKKLPITGSALALVLVILGAALIGISFLFKGKHE